MYLSKYFLPIIKENPAEAKIVSHRLMLRSGMVRQLSSGIYNWLPLGSRVLKKIENIVRANMDKAGANEVIMSTLQPASLWQESGRYDDYGAEMLKIKDRHENNLLYGPTNEEVVTDIFRKNITSYKDLPQNLYQIQWKFRDEIRPRFGVMRGREFLMKDAYSFDLDVESSKESYFKMFRAYIKIFKDLGLAAIPVKANTGPIGGDLSHEFQILAKTGESEIYYDAEYDNLILEDELDIEKLISLYAAADDMHDEKTCPIAPEKLRTKRGIEVGHIFHFGTKYSKSMDCYVMDQNDKKIFPQMGSYGVGVSRLVGAIIESSHDDNGIIWPESIAPFKVGLINLKPGEAEVDKVCQDLYNQMWENNIEVLYDDTKNSVGKKFANMDLIGLPWQVVIGARGIKNNIVEIKNRKTGEKQEVIIGDVIKFLS